MKFIDDGGSNVEPRIDVELSLAPGFLVTFAGARILRFPHLREPALSRVKPETLALVDALSAPSGRTLGTLIDGLVADEGGDGAVLFRFAKALEDRGACRAARAPHQTWPGRAVPLHLSPDSVASRCGQGNGARHPVLQLHAHVLLA